MRGRWVFTGPLLLLLAIAVAASPLTAFLVLAGAFVVGLALVAGRLVRRRPNRTGKG